MNTQHDITVSGKPLNPPKPPAKPHMLLWIDTETTGLTSFRLADQAIGGNPYQNHAGTHRVQDCIRRDINDYTAYLDIIRTGTQGDRQ